MEDLQPGDPSRIGPYRLVGVLGSGGMGKVYQGSSVGGRLVAVKVVRAEFAADPQFRGRSRQEVAAARRVSGLYTAPVIDHDADGPQPWLATAYVDGKSLAETVTSDGPLSPAGLRSLAAGLAEGLLAIHSAGLVHRDLKPSNVLMAADGPRVIDFGIAKALDATAVTATGVVVGTPEFMSPEQALGNDIGPASDIYSLGGVLIYAATGHGPFGEGRVDAVIYRVIREQPNLDGLAAEFQPMILRCMDKDPARRPHPADILAELGDAELAAVLAAPTAGRSASSDSVGAEKPGTPVDGDRTATVTRAAGGTPPALPVGPAAPAPPKPVSRRTWIGWSVAILTLTGATIAIALLLPSGSSSSNLPPIATPSPGTKITSVDQLVSGMCLDNVYPVDSNGNLLRVDLADHGRPAPVVVPCNQPHDAQTFGDPGSPGDKYPDAGSAADFEMGVCQGTPAQPYVNSPMIYQVVINVIYDSRTFKNGYLEGLGQCIFEGSGARGLRQLIQPSQ